MDDIEFVFIPGNMTVIAKSLTEAKTILENLYPDKVYRFSHIVVPIAKCCLCGEPMPPGEDMFKYHGYSGPCPKPPLQKKTENTVDELIKALLTIKEQHGNLPVEYNQLSVNQGRVKIK